MAMETFVHKTLKLLEREREAEINETSLLLDNTPIKELQRRGVCLLKLCIRERKTGLYGRTVLKFCSEWDTIELPSHNFTPGDIAGFGLLQCDVKEIASSSNSGIVTQVNRHSISLAIDELDEDFDFSDSTRYKLVKLANNVTFTRLKKALEKLNKYGSGPSSNLINVLFNISQPSPPISAARDGKGFATSNSFNTNLDVTQKEAVNFALHQRELSIIHGPPGTGKTTTVVEIIRQAVKQNLKILACAPSNIAVDNLVERLADHGIKLIRLGHPARLLPKIHKHSLDAVLANSEDTQLVMDVRSDMDKTLTKFKRCRNAGEKSSLRNEMKSLRKELRQREEAATRGILSRAQVVLSTLTGLSDRGPLKVLQENHFDLAVIDECSQAIEAACWSALLRAPRCVLAGDHLQLPPTIMCQEAAKDGLEVTLMERLLKMYGSDVMRMLTVQYRMNDVIMKWPSQQLYENKLTAHSSVADHLLKDLAGVSDTEDTRIPLLMIDTAGCDLQELQLPSEVSKGNEGEADLVSFHVEKLIKSGLDASDIAVIAPYNLQVELLRLRLSENYPKLEIKSVDGFQGREKEAVVMSMVRSNDKGEVGFLAEDRRINVAITRARRHLAVVCDSETIAHHAFLASFVDYMFEHAEVISADQYINDGAMKSHTKRPEYLDQQLTTGSGNQHGSDKSHSKKKSDKRPERNNKLKSKGRSTDEENKVKPPKTQAQLDREAKEEEEMRCKLQTFMMNESEQRLAFPCTFNSWQRFLVHKLADELGLKHESTGEGQQRQITVLKLNTATVATVPDVQATRHNNEAYELYDADDIDLVVNDDDEIQSNEAAGKIDEKVELCDLVNNKLILKDMPTSPGASAVNKIETPINRTDVKCSKCGKEIPVNNFALHEIRCKVDNTANIVKPKIVEHKPKLTKSKQKKKSRGENKVQEDFDVLIAEATLFNTICNYGKCKEYTTTVGQYCAFCAKRFCLSHHIPESHGCGSDAKINARRVIVKEGVLYRGSGVPDKKMDPQKQAYLHRKLDKKLNEFTDARKIKKKDK